jgi:hypothetical protein
MSTTNRSEEHRRRVSLLGDVQETIYAAERQLLITLEEIRKKHEAKPSEMMSAIAWDDDLLAERYMDWYGPDDDT